MKDYINNVNTLDFYLEKFNSDQSNLDLLNIISNKYLNRGKKDLAIKYYSILIEKDKNKKYSIPDYPYYLLAINSLKENNPKYAKEFIGNFTRSNFLNIVYLSLADFYLKTDNYIEARELYKEYLKKFPNDHISLNNFAYLSALLNKELILALNSIEKAITLSTDSYSKTQYLDTKAEVLIKLKRYEEAKETISIALDIIQEGNVELRNSLMEKLEKIKTYIKN